MSEFSGRWLAVLAGVFGALVTGLWVALGSSRPGQPESTRLRLLIEMLAAVFAGAVAAYFLAPPVAERLALTAAHDVAAVGFAIGLVFWRILPPALEGAERWVRTKLGGGA